MLNVVGLSLLVLGSCALWALDDLLNVLSAQPVLAKEEWYIPPLVMMFVLVGIFSITGGISFIQLSLMGVA